MKENFKKASILQKRPVALVAPLDWGLGHATRCIPLIKSMIQLDFEVIIAGQGRQEAILKAEFPTLKFVNLAGYKLKYGNSGWKTALKIFLQIPKILTAIKSETQWLDRFLAQNQVDLIISDNRYGLYHASVTSIFITHQLAIKMPFGSWAEGLVRQLHYRFINKFSECWIPDYAGEDNLAGELAHPLVLPSIPVKYLGALTRFNKSETVPRYQLCLILSGPEPQRSLLETIFLQELKDFNGHAVLVRGLPGDETLLPSFNKVTIHNHLPSEQLNEVVNASMIIVSRPGYSTVMDIVPLGKPCLFIPTPGQTEQEYLAHYLSQKRYCLWFRQQEFSLKQALQLLKQQQLISFEMPHNSVPELTTFISAQYKLFHRNTAG